MASQARRLVHTIRDRVARRAISDVAKAVLDNHLTYLSAEKLRNIEWAIATVKRDRVLGSFLETGVALGGSGILLATQLGRDRSYCGYDVFGMIPAPTDADPPEVHERYRIIASGEAVGIDGELYYGYKSALYEQVCSSFEAYSVPVNGETVCLYQGLFEETLYPTEPVALAHIDCDWYEPVLLSLERIYPQLQTGAIVIVDDYYSYGGAKTAVDEFRGAHDLSIVRRDRRHMILRRP